MGSFEAGHPEREVPRSDGPYDAHGLVPRVCKLAIGHGQSAPLDLVAEPGKVAETATDSPDLDEGHRKGLPVVQHLQRGYPTPSRSIMSAILFSRSALSDGLIFLHSQFRFIAVLAAKTALSTSALSPSCTWRYKFREMVDSPH